MTHVLADAVQAAAFLAVLAFPLLAVLPLGAVADWRVARRRARATRTVRPVVGEHPTQEYLRLRAMQRGVHMLAAALTDLQATIDGGAA